MLVRQALIRCNLVLAELDVDMHRNERRNIPRLPLPRYGNSSGNLGDDTAHSDDCRAESCDDAKPKTK